MGYLVLSVEREVFGKFSRVTPVRRVGNVCIDRNEERAMRALIDALTPDIFGKLNLVHPVMDTADRHQGKTSGVNP
jgi:hypothetical protein